MKTAILSGKRSTFFILTILLMSMFVSVRAQNLIMNPGCEDSLVNGEIPYWTEVVGTSWTQRANGNPPSYEGDYMFFPGVAAAAELQQDVDVSQMASTIDEGSNYFYFEGYVRVYNQSPPDRSRIVLEYLDTLKTTKLDSIDLGEYSNTTEWLQLTDTTLAPAGTRFIRIRLISTRFNGSNNDGYYDGLSLIPEVISGIQEGSLQYPDKFKLFQNYPNPFNPGTSIQYALGSGQFVTLKVYDVLGNEVAVLVNEEKPAGTYELTWNAYNLPSGVYYYQIQAGSYTDTRKMILLK